MDGPAHESSARAAFSPDGRRLISGGWDRWLKLWDTATGRETISIKGNRGFYDVFFDKTGDRIAAAGNEYHISLYEADPRGDSRPARLSLGEPYQPSIRFKEKMRMPEAPTDLSKNENSSAQTFEGEALATLAKPSGDLLTQTNMRDFGTHWSQGKQLLWQRTRKGDVLLLNIPVPSAGQFDLSAAWTRAPDYGIVGFSVADQQFEEPA